MYGEYLGLVPLTNQLSECDPPVWKFGTAHSARYVSRSLSLLHVGSLCWVWYCGVPVGGYWGTALAYYCPQWQSRGAPVAVGFPRLGPDHISGAYKKELSGVSPLYGSLVCNNCH